MLERDKTKNKWLKATIEFFFPMTEFGILSHPSQTNSTELRKACEPHLNVILGEIFDVYNTNHVS